MGWVLSYKNGYVRKYNGEVTLVADPHDATSFKDRETALANKPKRINDRVRGFPLTSEIAIQLYHEQKIAKASKPKERKVKRTRIVTRVDNPIVLTD